MNKIINILSNFKMIFLGLWLIMFVLSSTIGAIFGIVGIDLIQKQFPHNFDSSFLNYNTLYFMATMQPITMLGTTMLVILLVILWPNKKQQVGSVE